MVEKGIKPIYVFDGKAPELKSDTQAKRREIRDEAEKIYKEALKSGDTEKARKYAMRSSKLSPEIIESSKRLLTLMGIPYVEAKGEGEAQAAYLVEKGVSGEKLCEVIAKAQAARAEGKQVLVARMNKNKKFQKEQLTAEGYGEFEEFYKEGLKN